VRYSLYTSIYCRCRLQDARENSLHVRRSICLSPLLPRLLSSFRSTCISHLNLCPSNNNLCDINCENTTVIHTLVLSHSNLVTYRPATIPAENSSCHPQAHNSATKSSESITVTIAALINLLNGPRKSSQHLPNLVLHVYNTHISTLQNYSTWAVTTH